MLLSDKITAIYCPKDPAGLVDDLLKACHHHTPEGCRCSDAEIITTALVSALVFKGNQSLALEYMRTHNMAPDLPLKSGFTKRLHRLAELLYSLFQQMGAIIKNSIAAGCISWIAFLWQRATTSASADVNSSKGKLSEAFVPVKGSTSME